MRPVRCVCLAGFLPAVVAGLMLGGTGAAAAAAKPSGGTVVGVTAGRLQVGHLSRARQTRPNLTAGTTSSVASQSFGAPRNPFNPHRAIANARPTAAASVMPFPTVTCPGVGCATIASGSAVTQPALNATANGKLFGFDIEPPDQGLCAGHGDVMESINIGEIQVFNGSSLAPISGATSLDSLMGLTNLGWSSGGDVSCLFDPSNGGHWFITEFVATNSEANGGPFTSCFNGGIPDSCREGIAVSTGPDPTNTSWNVYFLDPNTFSPQDPGHPFLLNDFAKIATTGDAFLLFYDEFDAKGPYPPCPAADCLSFNGAQEFALDKNALEMGTSANLVHENMGTDPSVQPPDGNCMTGPGAGTDCWAQVIPAASPGGEFDASNGGTGFMVAALDFNSFATLTGNGDNRIAVFDWTGLSNISSTDCSACGSINFGHQLFTGVQSYTDDGQACLVSQGAQCGLAPQKAGTLDLGTFCKTFKQAPSQPCPENGLNTNGDGATQASYANGQLWFGVHTLLNQQFNAPNSIHNETHVGVAYWVLNANPFNTAQHALTLTSQGYVSAAHEDLLFPSVATDGLGRTLMSFTLSGDGGPTGADGGGFFPSSAYGLLSPTAPGLIGNNAFIADPGQGPQDGFTEYQPFPGFPGNGTRPRWGDYGAATFVPGTGPGTGFYFASEYIQSPACAPKAFRKDPTCGGTRDPLANFGTSINLVK
jgi:hypothetical protein